MSSATFLRGHVRSSLIQLDGGTARLGSVNELDRCGFRIEPPEPLVTYRLVVGNERPITPSVCLSEHVEWEQRHYFESARGEVDVRVQSRSDEDEAWNERATLLIQVVPTKVTEQQYQRMFDELRSLSVGLVFDLVSKAKLSFGPSTALGGFTARTSQLEVRVLADLWARLVEPLALIARAPLASLRSATQLRACWGAEQLSPSSTAQLAQRGEDPTRMSVRPFLAEQRVLEESFDLPENRTVIWFLRLLQERLRICIKRAHDQRREIEQEQLLYHSVDQTKQEALQRAVDLARSVQEQVQRAVQLLRFNTIQPEARLQPTEGFLRLPGYRVLFREAIRYLHSSLHVLDDGSQERGKSTSRLFEQWVFIQFIAALSDCGFESESVEHFVIPMPGLDYRFSVDIGRDTQACFSADRQRRIIIRYEPWIFNRESARSRGCSLYRGHDGAPWSPDILVEIHRESDSGADGRTPQSEVETAVVIDAKYSWKDSEELRFEVEKYFGIRRVGSREQVVSQVWVAVPRFAGIRLYDPDVQWTVQGPSTRDQMTMGMIGLADSVSSAVPDEVRVNPTMREFVAGIMSYLGIEPRRRLTLKGCGS